jgi:hypothetical protein
MLYEMQTYTLKARSPGVVEKLFAKAMAEGSGYPRLRAFWKTDVGTLNRIILVSEYENAGERERVLMDAKQGAGALPAFSEHIVEAESRLWTPAPFSPLLTPRQLGNCYEIRIYDYPAGRIPDVIENWNGILEERLKYSPLVAAWYSDTGPVHHWIHIWAYADAGERERVRAATANAGIWPISIVEQRLNRIPRFVALKMKNMLVVPAVFSPLR